MKLLILLTILWTATANSQSVGSSLVFEHDQLTVSGSSYSPDGVIINYGDSIEALSNQITIRDISRFKQDGGNVYVLNNEAIQELPKNKTFCLSMVAFATFDIGGTSTDGANSDQSVATCVVLEDKLTPPKGLQVQ